MNGQKVEHDQREQVDYVSGAPAVTAFKQRARSQQALWREANKFPIGSVPYRAGPKARAIGSRLELKFAQKTGSNFLSQEIAQVVRRRVAEKQRGQTLNADRLYADLLSSMPMCFNLFGSLALDTGKATRAVRAWWPDVPGTVTEVRFEWSPARHERDKYLGNGSAFDVAFILDLGAGKSGVIGIETKYHEHCLPRKLPSKEPARSRELAKRKRYHEVSRRSCAFKEGSEASIVGTPLHQIWLDHLLVLSMLQEEREWAWGRFCLVYPEANPSFASAATQYENLLADRSTFSALTIEQLLDAEALDDSIRTAFRRRYLWR